MGRGCSCAILIALLAGCSSVEPDKPPTTEQQDTIPPQGTVVYRTDSTLWTVYIFQTGVLYGSGYSVDSPYHIPTKAEATVLHTISYVPGNGERFVTCDGYTFGMPSASVTKAGQKTKYSVLGLYIKPAYILVEF